MAQNPPCRHPCNRSLLYTCTPACRLHYNPSPPFPPLLPQPIIHFLLLGKALVLQVHPATGCLFRKALGVLLQCYASRSSSGEVSDTSSSLALPKVVRGGGGALYPAVSLCLCCFTPAAARHQARLFQLTLDCINNGLLCTFPSSNTLQLFYREQIRPGFDTLLVLTKSVFITDTKPVIKPVK